jgi:hypothetical protein
MRWRRSRDEPTPADHGLAEIGLRDGGRRRLRQHLHGAETEAVRFPVAEVLPAGKHDRHVDDLAVYLDADVAFVAERDRKVVPVSSQPQPVELAESPGDPIARCGDHLSVEQPPHDGAALQGDPFGNDGGILGRLEFDSGHAAPLPRTPASPKPGERDDGRVLAQPG